MHVALAPDEALLPGAREAIGRAFDDPAVAAALLPLVPQGSAPLARAARTYLARWDGRFLHPQNYFAPAARVALREPAPGWRNGDWAPRLAEAIDEGRRVVALPAAGVASPLASDLGAWARHFRAQGLAWGALAARDARYAGFLPARGWSGWARHNLREQPRRTIEALQAVRTPAPLPWVLHVVREAAWSGGCARGYRSPSRLSPPAAD